MPALSAASGAPERYVYQIGASAWTDLPDGFAITAEGAAHLSANKPEVDAALAKLAALAAQRERFDGVTVRRAMLNLRMSIRGRLLQEGADKAVMREVTAILDEAARKIEAL